MQKTFFTKDFRVDQPELIYKGYFSITRLHIKYRLFNGGWNNGMTRDLIERYPAVAILPYDPVRDRVILIEQFRIGAIHDPVSPWQIEIPAGIIDTDESPEAVARREAEEEAGCTISNIKLLYDFYVSPGASNEYLHIYYGEVDSSCVEGIHGLQAEQEDIKVLNLTREAALEALHQNKIKNMPALVALQWLEMNYRQLR